MVTQPSRVFFPPPCPLPAPLTDAGLRSFILKAQARVDASVLGLSLVTASRAPRNPRNSTRPQIAGLRLV